MIILGAGMAGCLAGMIFPEASILEAQSNKMSDHQALLRFRSDRIAEFVGVQFKKVTVTKAIWSEGAFAKPNPRVFNLYSTKVVGAPQQRSIQSLEPETRWIASENFQSQLRERLSGRITFEHSVSHSDLISGNPIISTLPINVLANILGESIDAKTDSSSIWVERRQLEGANTYQTIYFPDPDTPVYRASISGDVLIIESVSDPSPQNIFEVEYAFGIENIKNTVLYSGTQKLGKIVPLPDKVRKEFLFKISSKYNIWSLGRFACWRNILLDDVFHDIFHIKRMITQDLYDIRKEL